MKMTASILFSLVVSVLTLIPAPAIRAVQVMFTFEGGNNGTVDGIQYGSQDPQGFAAFRQNGFVIDVMPSGAINGNLHWHEVDSTVTPKVPDSPSGPGVLWRDSIAPDPLFFAPVASGATFSIESLWVGASTADGSQTTGVRLSGFRNGVLVGTVDLPTLADSYVKYSGATLGVLHDIDKLEFVGLSTSSISYYMLDDVVFDFQQGPRFTPQEKQTFKTMAVLLGAGALSLTAASNFCGFIPNPFFQISCRAIVGTTGVSFGYIAFKAGQAANDPPDPNFMAISQPVIPSLPPLVVGPGVTQEMVNAWSALSSNLTQTIGFWRALITAVERAQGAADAGNVFWETLQLQAAAQFASQLATLHSTQPTLRTNMQSALQKAEFPSIPITASDVSQFQNGIIANGLPSSLTNLLTQLGADSMTIDEIESLLITQDPNDAVGSFPEILTNPLMNASFQEVAQVLDKFALSTPPPIPGDPDRDGVPNGGDVCPNSSLRATVIIDRCDSGVTEHLDVDGCTISDQITGCVSGARNHGQFVSCVAHLTDDLQRAGIIGGKEKGAIQSCAARSNLP